MGVCPKCKAQIDHLEQFQTKTVKQDVSIVGGQLITDAEENEWLDNTEYCCPVCNMSVADNASDAIDVLNARNETDVMDDDNEG